jgi:hypothetical protein
MLTVQFQERGLWQANLMITRGATGNLRLTADRAILSALHHGTTPGIRAFAERLRKQHGIVAPGFAVEGIAG